MKRAAEPVKKDNFKSLLMFGDICHLPLDHLSSLVDSVSLKQSSPFSLNDTKAHSIESPGCPSLATELYSLQGVPINMYVCMYMLICMYVCYVLLASFPPVRPIQLLVPMIANAENQTKWPGVVSRDVMTHFGGLKGDVYQFSGQVKGKTLLPLPPQVDSMAMAVECQEK